MFELKVVDHPYVQVVLTQLRDRRTGQIEFRKGLVRLGRALGLEMVKDFEVEEVLVETPLGVRAKGVRFKNFDKVVIVTVLRAGMPLTEGLIKVFYNAKQGVVSARRLEEKGMKDGWFDVEISYARIPRIDGETTVIVSDPMIATASTTRAVLRKALEFGRPRRFMAAGAIATPLAVERIRRISEELGIDVKMYVASVDPLLDDRGYIVPGLGDAGDRAFGE
ncbi:MAG: uracil phosphoribosyltransferase [Desulfurococcaceae archaeon]